MASVALNQPVVLDLGSGLTKSGFAGSPTPVSIIGSVVARPKLPRILPTASGATGRDAPIVGDAIAGLAGVVRVTHPLSRGSLDHLDDAQTLWDHVLQDILKISHGEHPALITENALNARRNREKLAEIFFEAFRVPSLYVSAPPVLSLYASGRTTGVVLDVGDSVMTAVPIAEGHIASHAISRVDVGGRDVTERLGSLLRKSGASLLSSSSEKDAVRRIKERVCYVTADMEKENKRELRGDLPDLPFELPDGNIVNVGSERFRAAELLFDPSLVGAEFGGAHQVVHEAVQRTDVALRRKLYGSVLLAGGASKTAGFAPRLLSELKALPPAGTQIRIHAPSDRLTSAYTGGSILASLSAFGVAAVSRQEYLDRGEIAIHRTV